ncbi:MAG: hypothetical protein IKC45_03460 [Clostridia bacterium]|nr:hypothetical protein [Clostridia bacterium]
MGGYLIIATIFAVPIIAVIGWILNLIKYSKAKKENQLNPSTYGKEEMKAIKTNFIISSVIAFVLIAVIVSLIVTFALGIAYM